jgi:hypothetical protein
MPPQFKPPTLMSLMGARALTCSKRDGMGGPSVYCWVIPGIVLLLLWQAALPLAACTHLHAPIPIIGVSCRREGSTQA